ncbi:phospholipase D/Transphosphatidylase [Pedosphaera parvula Ellin514]|uniref:Phospholipase D/Transphosphatidylase n=2 Tax=Pedosphaera TaxID=1032526 RepID=B9XFG8_PEDPL|nr:phospholipase D/Transphosphatidylase [Pedosphaera parvula Ellin514]
MLLLNSNCYNWLCTGNDVFPAMLEAIHSAQKSIRLETYIYSDDSVGEKFRQALIQACQRGIKVKVMVDSLGSQRLRSDYWQPLIAAGGEARWFNPNRLKRFGFRDHRKMLVCDEEVAFVGGFNIAKEYEGDGIKTGWYDLGLRIENSLAADLAATFDEMFGRAYTSHKRFAQWRKSSAKKDIIKQDGELLLSGPGRGSPFKRALRTDLMHARSVQIIAAYFVPTRKIRRDLFRIARRGGRVQLILAGKSDVTLSQLAGQSLYRRMLRAGIEIYEYQPQILHAKMILVDDVVYVGSSNLDPRSLYINYEFMLRFKNDDLADEARSLFENNLQNCRQIELEAWRKSRSWWERFKQRWAYFIIARADPIIARWQAKWIPS